ncbi:putative capsid protein [Camel associated porprismacovirus 4]|uniref:Putative capsid protein n=1 Tax=Camel associated porprismacovirus 4 TaxID=2170108 RepID=A0A0A1EJ99_9VIRU|nr:putative capsid protein [Camel associated porprismacovirus 4]AIY31260.1 putative capsid protein [Camel associated porprismacovirus 4]
MATQTVHATYQEIYDLSTKPGTLSVIGVHTPTGRKPYDMLQGFFRQFKKYKYNGITRLVLQPAAQLPADPLQVSLEAGENLDPRDLLNPIMFHGAHGTDINAALNVIYKKQGFNFQTNSTDTIDLSMFANVEGEVMDSVVVENMYYSALSDPSFRKYGVQEVIDIGPLVPLVFRVNTNMYFGPQMSYPRDVFPNVGTSSPNGGFSVSDIPSEVWNGSSNVSAQTYGTDMTDMQIFTNGVTELSWMPTRNAKPSSVGTDGSPTNTAFVTVPKLYMGAIIMPPAYNQRLFYRCVITHSFTFSDFGTYFDGGLNGGSECYYNNLDYVAPATMSSGNLDSLNLTDVEGTMRTSGVM